MCNTTKFNKRSTLTDFSKNAILNCYRAILDYLHDDEVESEEIICFNFMMTLHDIEKDLEAFAMENLYPLLTNDFSKYKIFISLQYLIPYLKTK